MLVRSGIKIQHFAVSEKLLEVENGRFECRGLMLVMLGCMVMCSYNEVPDIRNYWSENESLANSALKNAISRNRFKTLHSKKYFNHPEKPPECSKIYYI